MSGFASVGYFIFSLIFSLLSFVLIARIVLRYLSIGAQNQVGHIIYSITDPIIKPLERFITPSSNYDIASFILLVAVELLKFILVGLFFFKTMIPLYAVLLFTVADLILQPCNLLFYAIIIRAVMSWVNPAWQHPIADIIQRVTEPLLGFIRRFIPAIGGIDFSPLIAIVILEIISLFIGVIQPIH